MRYNRAVSPNTPHSGNLLRRLKAQDNKIIVINNNDLPRPTPLPVANRRQTLQQPPSRRVEISTLKVQDSAKAIPRNPQVQLRDQNSRLQRQEVNKRKEPRVTYTSRSVDPMYVDKARRIKNSGRGKILIIVGNGPTVNDVDLRLLKNKPGLEIMSINYPDPRIWPTDYWAFFDHSQAQRHAALWDDYNGVIFNSASIQKRKAGTIQFRNIGAKKFSKDLTDGICIGRSSVYASMQIALWMDFDRVYIFGVDMNPASDLGKLHFYGTNPDVLPETRAKRFDKEAEYYVTAWESMSDTERTKFVFCSSVNPWPFVKMFHSRDQKIVIPEILQAYSELNRKVENV
jgi:hypothetical protein